MWSITEEATKAGLCLPPPYLKPPHLEEVWSCEAAETTDSAGFTDGFLQQLLGLCRREAKPHRHLSRYIRVCVWGGGGQTAVGFNVNTGMHLLLAFPVSDSADKRSYAEVNKSWRVSVHSAALGWSSGSVLCSVLSRPRFFIHHKFESHSEGFFS